MEDLSRYSFNIHTKGDPNLTVPWFLMASYLYYKSEHQVGLMEDYDFDQMCKFMYDNWDNVEHIHKYLIDKEALSAGTGFYIEEYPSITVMAATQLAKEFGLI